jgi:hypothetical protein
VGNYFIDKRESLSLCLEKVSYFVSTMHNSLGVLLFLSSLLLFVHTHTHTHTHTHISLRGSREDRERETDFLPLPPQTQPCDHQENSNFSTTVFSS